MKFLSALFILLIFSACGGSTDTGTDVSTELALELPAVPDYQLADTTPLLNDINNQLSTLTLQDFFAQSFQIIQERDIENGVAAGLVDDFPLGT